MQTLFSIWQTPKTKHAARGDPARLAGSKARRTTADGICRFISPSSSEVIAERRAKLLPDGIINAPFSCRL